MKKLVLIIFILHAVALHAQSDARMVVQTGHFNEITSMQFSPNGKWLASGGKDHAVILYDVKTGLQMATLKGLNDWVTQVEFSADNKKVIGVSSRSANNWSGLCVWNVATGDTAFTVPELSCGHISSFKQCTQANKLVIMADALECLQFQMHDLTSGKKITDVRLDDDASDHWLVTPDAKLIVYENRKGQLVLINAETGAEKTRYDVSEFKTTQTSRGDIVFLSDDNKFYYRSIGLSKWLKINLANGEIVRTNYDGIRSETPDAVHVNKLKSQVYVSFGARVGIYSLPDMKLVEMIEYSKVGYASASAACHEKKLMALASRQNVYFFNIEYKRVVNEFISSPCQPLQAIFSNNSKTIAIADYYSPVKVYDLQSADAVKTFEGLSLNSQKYDDLMHFSPDDKVLFIAGDHPQLIHIPSQEQKNYYDHYYINFSGSRHFSDGRRIISSDFTKLVYGNDQYEMQTGKPLCEYTLGAHAGPLHYTPDGNYVYQYTHSYEDDSVLIFAHDAVNCMLTYTYKIPDKFKLGKVAVSRDSKKIAVAGTGIAIANFLTGKILHYVKEEELIKNNKNFTREFYCSALGFSPDGNLLAVADKTTNSVGIYSAESGKVIHVLRGHDDEIYSLEFSPDGKKIVTVGADKKIMVWNALKGTLDVTFVPYDETDYVAFTPDNYYMCSKNGLNAVAFRINNKMFKAEQFDLRQNRPDTVLQRLGYASKFSIKMYKKAWKKRISRAGYTEEMLGSDYEIPEAEILNAQIISEVTSDESLTLDLLFSDSVNTLDRYNVYVNDVPLYGVNGVSLRGQNLHTIKPKVQLELSYGNNQILITAFNRNGAESIRESINVIRNGTPPSKPNLYVLAVGVSGYKDMARDLKFAAKDATDLIHVLKTQSPNFDTVHVKLITSTEATRNEVLKAGALFKQARIEDQVILYFSGHGLLDEQLNYYLAMHDVDFANPANGGLLFEDFEKMVDSIPCRNRLILVDACHSGEVDKEEAVVLNNTSTTHVTSGVRSGGVTVQPKVGLKNSLALMKQMFTDTQKGSGATVISAAGGLEYALESKDWNNGVFTYSLLQGMREQKADADFDKKIRISELQMYVTKTVFQLTKGVQQPTTRRENAVNNFVVY